MNFAEYRCAGYSAEGEACAHMGTHIGDDGRRYCARHAAERLLPGHGDVSKAEPIDSDFELDWAQASFAAGRPDPSGIWHGFAAGEADRTRGYRSLCGLRFLFLGPRRRIEQPLAAFGPGLCRPCRVALGRRAQAESPAGARADH
jgi:hypothetical protein